jgi:hypothetical protein
MNSSRLLKSPHGYADACEIYNQHYLDNRWGDGLRSFLLLRNVSAGCFRTSLDRHVKIRTVIPVRTATIEKIAINAVMAGAKRIIFPVILAAMEGLTEPDYDLMHMQVPPATSPWLRGNGPIAKEIEAMHGDIVIWAMAGGLITLRTDYSSLMAFFGSCLARHLPIWPVSVVRHPYFLYLTENSELSPWERTIPGSVSKEVVWRDHLTIGVYSSFGVIISTAIPARISSAPRWKMSANCRVSRRISSRTANRNATGPSISSHCIPWLPAV